MSDESLSNSRDAALVPLLHQARRDRWASTVAKVAVVVHCLSAVTVIGWNYYIVPGYKKRLDDLFYVGGKLSEAAVFLIHQSDMLVNYWYMLVPPLVAGLVCDYLITRRIAKQIGLRWAWLCVACIAVVLLSNVVVGKYILEHEKARLIEHIAVHGPPPKQ